MIERTEYLEQLKRFKDKDLIKVVTGIRRCGKSTLYDLFIRYLKENELYHEPFYEPEEVHHFQMYLMDQTDYEYGDDTAYASYTESIVEYSEEEQIEALCKVFRPDVYSGDWYSDADADDIYVYAILNDNYMNSVYGMIPRDKAPAFLKRDLLKLKE